MQFPPDLAEQLISSGYRHAHKLANQVACGNLSPAQAKLAQEGFTACANNVLELTVFNQDYLARMRAELAGILDTVGSLRAVDAKKR